MNTNNLPPQPRIFAAQIIYPSLKGFSSLKEFKLGFFFKGRISQRNIGTELHKHQIAQKKSIMNLGNKQRRAVLGWFGLQTIRPNNVNFVAKTSEQCPIGFVFILVSTKEEDFRETHCERIVRKNRRLHPLPLSCNGGEPHRWEPRPRGGRTPTAGTPARWPAPRCCAAARWWAPPAAPPAARPAPPAAPAPAAAPRPAPAPAPGRPAGVGRPAGRPAVAAVAKSYGVGTAADPPPKKNEAGCEGSC